MAMTAVASDPQDLRQDLRDPFGLEGTLLEGQYRVDAIVGEGGFGVVYRGRHLSLDQPIAIKVLKGLDGGDTAINALVLEKFRAEARLLYTLSQSSLHIVRALDFGATTTPAGVWAPFMVLEWLEGRSLEADFAERRGRGLRGRSLAEALEVLRPVADGLTVAHQRHVVHRDVKPANIFLLAPGGGPSAKVLDFGIAKIMKEGEAAGTKGTFAAFTWLYAAPEQLDPRLGATSLATDVYAFALLLTELLTDKKPMDQPDTIAIMKAAIDPYRRPSPRAKGANVPDGVEAICVKALAVDPKARFPSIVELWSALTTTHGGTHQLPAVQAPVAPPHAPSSPFLAPASSNPLPTPQPSVRHTSLPMSSPQPSLPQPSAPQPSFQGGVLPMRPPYVTPPGVSPPRGTHPPGFAPPPFPPAMPRRLPFARAEGSSPLVPVTIVLFVLAMLLAGSCVLAHATCG
jgi:serine/threonine protein kinase